MTRQWTVGPSLMCKQHLLGEHFEAHIFVSKMEKGWSLEGFRKGSMFFGAAYIKARHDMIVDLLTNHNTPLKLTQEMLDKYPLINPTFEDFDKSKSDLLGRCEKCRILNASISQ